MPQLQHEITDTVAAIAAVNAAHAAGIIDKSEE
ncbi:hypothetical protein A203_16600 [Chromobacterium violaceum]